MALPVMRRHSSGEENKKLINKQAKILLVRHRPYGGYLNYTGNNTVWHEIFAIFPAIRKNKFLQIKITENTFPSKIYSRVNFLLTYSTKKLSVKLHRARIP